MYRQYEIEKKLEELKEEYCTAIEKHMDENTLINIQCDIAELEDKINFAWQDDEEEY